MNKIIQEKMLELFQSHIPQSLYYNYEELAEHLGSTPKAWEDFLDLPEIHRLIENKLNKYLQIDARKALHRLATSNLSSQDIAALRHLIESSNLLKAKTETKQNIIVTHIPPTQREEDQNDKHT